MANDGKVFNANSAAVFMFLNVSTLNSAMPFCSAFSYAGPTLTMFCAGGGLLISFCILALIWFLISGSVAPAKSA